MNRLSVLFIASWNPKLLLRTFLDFYVETGGCGQVAHGRFPTARSSAHFQLLIFEEGLGLAGYSRFPLHLQEDCAIFGMNRHFTLFAARSSREQVLRSVTTNGFFLDIFWCFSSRSDLLAQHGRIDTSCRWLLPFGVGEIRALHLLSVYRVKSDTIFTRYLQSGKLRLPLIPILLLIVLCMDHISCGR